MIPRSAEARALEDEIAGRICIRCDSGPRIAVRDAQYAIVCNCEQGPVLGREPHVIERRYSKMVETALTHRPNDMPLSLEEITTYICPTADQTEAMIFLKFCQGQGLNPFLKDVYLIKYDRNKPASIVIGIQALLKRAAGNPHYQGYQSGVVVLTTNGEMIERDGSLTVDTDTLVGGWAVIRRDDWPEPLKVTVALKEYDRHQAQWTEKPGTMIEKCAVGQGHRRAFPGEVGRLYEDAGLAVEVGDVEEASAVVVVPPELTANGAPEKAPEDAPEPTTETAPTRPKLDHPGDLLNAAKDRWGKTSKDVCAALDVTEPGQIITLRAAWVELVKLWEVGRKEHSV